MCIRESIRIRTRFSRARVRAYENVATMFVRASPYVNSECARVFMDVRPRVRFITIGNVLYNHVLSVHEAV